MTDRQAYAVYRASVNGAGNRAGIWTWGSIAIWGPDLPPYLGCGVTELRTYLSCDAGASFERGISDWVDDLKSIAENGEAMRKAREAKRREIKRDFGSGKTVEALAAYYGESVEDVRKMVAKRSSGAKKEAGG